MYIYTIAIGTISVPFVKRLLEKAGTSRTSFKAKVGRPAEPQLYASGAYSFRNSVNCTEQYNKSDLF
jgi:hypothetical protein